MPELVRSSILATAAMLAVAAGTAVAAGPVEPDFSQWVNELGDPARGKELIVSVGCGACHIIPGVVDANGLVGPPLDHMARRQFVAGVLRNTPDNMVHWLRAPQQVVPGNAMPDLGLSQQDAQEIAAYLYTLR